MRRPEPYGIAATATAENSQANVYGYAGFCVQHFGLRPEEVVMELYKMPNKFASFMSFLQQRGVEASTLRRHISTASKVAAYLKSTSPARSPEEHWNNLESWYKRFSSQVYKAAHTFGKRRRDEERDPLPSASAYMGLLDNVSSRCEEMKSRDKVHNRGNWSSKTLLCMRDKAMLSALYGHMPTMRLGTLRTLAHPDHVADGGCTDADCKDSQCAGNKMAWVYK